MSIPIDVCCNDPDNGLFDHVANQIQVVEYEFLTLSARNWCRPPRFIETANGFRLAGKNWDVESSQDWVGNWCWNRYWLTPKTAAAFLAWLHGRNLFSVDIGERRLFDCWKRDEWTELDSAFLRRQFTIEQLETNTA